MPEQSNDYRVAVFGAAGVGKTSLVLRFTKDTFRDHYTPTIEDTYREVISCNNQVCTLQITDTTGSHQFPAMQRLSIEKGHAFILVYAVNNRASIEELKNVYLEIKKIKADTLDNLPMIMVGNKCDSATRDISQKLASEVAKKWGCAYIETSAKSDVNVKEMFETLLTLDKNRSMSLQVADDKSKKKAKGDKSNKKGSDKSKGAAADKPGTAVKDPKAAAGGSSGGQGGAASNKKSCLVM